MRDYQNLATRRDDSRAPSDPCAPYRGSDRSVETAQKGGARVESRAEKCTKARTGWYI